MNFLFLWLADVAQLVLRAREPVVVSVDMRMGRCETLRRGYERQGHYLPGPHDIIAIFGSSFAINDWFR